MSLKRIVGLGLAYALVLGTAVLPAGPASADPGQVTVAVTPPVVGLTVGGAPAALVVTATNAGALPAAGGLTVAMPAEMTALGVTFSGANGGCQATPNSVICGGLTVPPGQALALTLAVAPPTHSGQPAGQVATGAGQVTGAFVTGASQDSVDAPFTISLTGASTAGVPIVSGTVLDVAGAGVPGVTVTITDAAGLSRKVTTDAQGVFTDTPATPAEQWAPGPISLTPSLGAVTGKPVTRTGVASQPLTDLELRMPASAVTAPPTPAVSASPVVIPSSAAPAAVTIVPKDTGVSTLAWVVIGLGLLLIVVGGIVIFLLFRNRDGDAPAGPAPALYRSGAHQPPSYDQTQLLPRIPGAAPADAATQRFAPPDAATQRISMPAPAPQPAPPVAPPAPPTEAPAPVDAATRTMPKVPPPPPGAAPDGDEKPPHPDRHMWAWLDD